MGFQPVSITGRQVNTLLEMRLAGQVDRCREIIAGRLRELLAGTASAELAAGLWEGSINITRLEEALMPEQECRHLVAELELELAARLAGILRRPVKLELRLPPLDQNSRVLLADHLDAGWETFLLAGLLNKTCHLVWHRATGNLPWPLKELKPDKRLSKAFDIAPTGIKECCLQELTAMIEGLKISLQHYLMRELGRQVALQAWALYDAVTAIEKMGKKAVGPETNNIA
ncbi:hypothetical protein [Moorella sp. Hama-1]|uniref:hypothetical protein n=1 Tax=Moorella sp. Hama-1 TaxID=2138101 RepID=UPI000D65E845|nr:hypothetical protein [Moorella sp. Hama-1]BCV20288.1 hypothetical protein hamaS1_03570 [Moorella sp. Hama-1]